MNMFWGIFLLIISSIAYFGQVVAAFWPETAVKLSLTEPKSEVDPTFYADVRGEAYWDVVILWPLPLAGILLLLNNPNWSILGLIGGGIYLYFAGRGIITRRIMQRQDIKIGSSETLKVNYAFLVVIGLAALVTIVMAISKLFVG